MKRNVFLRMIVLCICLSMSLSLFGCSNGGKNNGGEQTKNEEAAEQQSDGNKKKEITIIVDDQISDLTGMNKFEYERQKEFEKQYPWIKVKHIAPIVVEIDKGVASLITVLMSKDGPSLFKVSAINWARDLDNAGLIGYWDDFVKDWTDYSDIYDNIKTAYMNNHNHIIGFSPSNEIPLLGFNKDMLVAKGIDPDTLQIKTWDEYRDICKKLNDEAKGVKGSSLLLTEFFLWFNNWNVANGAKMAITDPENGKMTLNFTEQNTIETINFFRKLYHEDKSVQDNLSIGLTDLLAQIWQNKLASFTFYPTWAAWFAGSGMPATKIKLMAFPEGPSGKGSNPLFPQCYVINGKKSKEEQAAAAEYIKFLYGIEGTKARLQFAKDNNILFVQIPVFKSLDWTQYAVGIPSDWVQATQDALTRGMISDLGSNAFTNYVVNILPKLVSEPNIEIEAELARAQKLAENEWLNLYNEDK